MMGVGNDADNLNADDGRATSLGRIIIIVAALDATNKMVHASLLLISEMTQKWWKSCNDAGLPFLCPDLSPSFTYSCAAEQEEEA